MTNPLSPLFIFVCPPPLYFCFCPTAVHLFPTIILSPSPQGPLYSLLPTISPCFIPTNFVQSRCVNATKRDTFISLYIYTNTFKGIEIFCIPDLTFEPDADANSYPDPT